MLRLRRPLPPVGRLLRRPVGTSSRRSSSAIVLRVTVEDRGHPDRLGAGDVLAEVVDEHAIRTATPIRSAPSS